MPSFVTSRGSQLTYRRIGQGRPLLCIPGGPLVPTDYFGDLGGVDADAELVFFNPPGSAGVTESDPVAYRADHVADDLEELRRHLGFEEIDLLGHSAGANVALRFAERHPERIRHLILVTPSTRAVGIDPTDEERGAVVASRAGEPWFDAASEALGRVQAGEATAADRTAMAPLTYGRWDAAAAELNDRIDAGRTPEAVAAFDASGAYDPAVTKAALGHLSAPVTAIGGELDFIVPAPVLDRLIALFPDAQAVVQPGAGHYPWADDGPAFAEIVRSALARPVG